METIGDIAQGVRGWPVVVLAQRFSCFSNNSSREHRPTFHFALEKVRFRSTPVNLDCYDVIAAHRHFAVIFPSEPIDSDFISRGVLNVLTPKNFSQISRTKALGGRQFLADILSRRLLCRAGALFRR